MIAIANDNASNNWVCLVYKIMIDKDKNDSVV